MTCLFIAICACEKEVLHASSRLVSDPQIARRPLVKAALHDEEPGRADLSPTIPRPDTRCASSRVEDKQRSEQEATPKKAWIQQKGTSKVDEV